MVRLGHEFEIMDSGLEEHLDGLHPGELVTKLALDKARVARPQVPQGIVIGADTVIDLDGQVLGKPTDPDDAARILRRLRGRTHSVLTGVAVIETSSGKEAMEAVATRVTMRDYSENTIEHYVRTGEPMDKAGAYAIQGFGSELVKGIEGCYYNVVGFPMCEVANLLSLFGIRPQSAAPVCALPGGSPCPRLTARRAAGQTQSEAGSDSDFESRRSME